MSSERVVRNGEAVLDANTNNDSSCVSASMSNNEESLASDSRESCLAGIAANKKTPSLPVLLIGSDEDSEHKSLQINDFIVAGKIGNKHSEQTELGSSTSDNRPVFSVSFRNRDIARKYKATIRKFLKELIAQHDPDNEADTSDLELDVWEEEDEDSEDHDNAESNLFQVDTHPTTKDDLQVPTYSQPFSEILQKAEESARTNQDGGRSSSCCFNCQGSHNLRDCPLPIQPSVVSKNRREFSARVGYAHKTSRYHLEDENKYAEFVPGQISAKLRKALGLPRYRLPTYIYRMRLLGYPPGWLEDARISHSGLALYDSQGKEVAEPYVEEGEIISEGSRDEYDITKIIGYPGFNVPCSADTVDASISSLTYFGPFKDM